MWLSIILLFVTETIYNKSQCVNKYIRDADY